MGFGWGLLYNFTVSINDLHAKVPVPLPTRDAINHRFKYSSVSMKVINISSAECGKYLPWIFFF